MNTAVFATPEKITSEAIEALKTRFLILEINYTLKAGEYYIRAQTNNLDSKLFVYENKTDVGKEPNWNASEQVLLDTKRKLQALQNKMKFEGDWGRLKLAIPALKGKKEKGVKLKYNYSF